MALVEIEMKFILYLGLFLFMALYNLKDGLLKTILNTAYIPLALVLVMDGINTTFGVDLGFLLGYVILAIVFNVLYNLFVVTLPEAKQKQKNKYFQPRR